MIMLPIAHAGHWFEGALYLAPVVILVVVLFVQGRRDHDEDVEIEPGDPGPERGETKAPTDARV
jgi:hypothetical protein